jgi:hypothetical protein
MNELDRKLEELRAKADQESIQAEAGRAKQAAADEARKLAEAQTVAAARDAAVRIEVEKMQKAKQALAPLREQIVASKQLKKIGIRTTEDVNALSLHWYSELLGAWSVADKSGFRFAPEDKKHKVMSAATADEAALLTAEFVHRNVVMRPGGTTSARRVAIVMACIFAASIMYSTYLMMTDQPPILTGGTGTLTYRLGLLIYLWVMFKLWFGRRQF